jgi:hypothetical protein
MSNSQMTPTPRRDRNEEEARSRRANRDDEPRSTQSTGAVAPDRMPAPRQTSAPARAQASNSERKRATGLASLMVGALIHEGVLDIDVTDPEQMEDYQRALRTLAGIIISLELVPEDDRPLFDL